MAIYFYRFYGNYTKFASSRNTPAKIRKIFMLRNYFRVAVRHLRRDTTHSFINIAGLGVGMAVVFLIASWIYNECSYDTYNPNYNRIARIEVTYSPNSGSYVS